MYLLYNNQADFTPPSEKGSSISAGAVVGIVAAVAIIIILIFGILWWKGCLGKKNTLAKGEYNEITNIVMIIKHFAKHMDFSHAKKKRKRKCM